MACPVTFDNNAQTGLISGAASSSGIWELIGYSTTSAGPFGPGGNFPTSTPTWGQSIPTDNLVTGFYQFKYKADLPETDDCYGEAFYVLAVVQGTTDVPANVSFDICSNDAIRNIFDDADIYDLASVNPVDWSIGGPGTSSPGYNADDTTDLTDDEYDPSAETSYPQIRVFNITYTPQAPSGFTLSGCDNCDAETMTVTYNVTEAFSPGNPSNIAACNDGDV